MTFSNNFHRPEARLQSRVGRAIGDFSTIEDGDTILVCLSGGRDPYMILSVLMALQKRAPVDFELIVMDLDQKQPGLPEKVLPNYLEKLGVEYVIAEADMYSIVKEKVSESKATCSLCSRLCRGVIHRAAKELGTNKTALDHHRDDIVNTFFLSTFFSGKMKSTPPRLATDNGDHIVIRPLAYCAERDIVSYTRVMESPIVPCSLCDSQEDLQHKKIEEMLLGWERQTPGRIGDILVSLWNTVPSHLTDIDLFDLNGLTTGLAKISEGALFGQTVYDQASLMPAGLHDNRIEFVRSERKPGDRLAEQTVPGKVAAN